MSFDFGDVVLVPFPFTSQTASKKRPAVVLSTGRYNRMKPDVVPMAKTSQLQPMSGAYEIAIADWRGAGLLKESVAKPVFATLEKQLVLKTLRKLGAADADALRQSVAAIFGLST